MSSSSKCIQIESRLIQTCLNKYISKHLNYVLIHCFFVEKSPKASDKIIDKRNIAEPGKNSSMGALDTPIGTKFGEKLSPRATLGKPKSLRSGGSGLPPMNGSASENDIAQLPPLQGVLPTPSFVQPKKYLTNLVYYF